MAGRIRDEDVAQVRERSPIAEVIGEHLQLRAAGAGRVKGLCPFHDEKTPSFSVNAALGFYHCFGCGESGDVLTFVQKIEHLSFPEAVEALARRAGVPLTYEHGGAAPRQQQGQRQRLQEAHAAAAAFYAEQLATPQGEPARRYLTDRGFDPPAWRTYGCGYAPAGWDSLLHHLTGRGFSREELTVGGLVKRSARGSLIDVFRGRLLWPIRDTTGVVVGFNARRLTEDDTGPKYLNSPETPIFRKSAVLYGLDLAKREIAREHRAVVVEGVSDVMACHLAGVPTAVATCGTAFGPEHIAVLRRVLMDQDEFRGEVIFTFDGDAAGQKAALKAFAEDQRFVSQTFVAVEPTGLDPCELRQRHGDAAVRDLVARRVPLVAFALRSVLARYDLETPEGRVAALGAAAPLVAAIKDRSLRPEYGRRLAGWLGMEVEPVLARVAELAGGARPPSRPVQRSPEGSRPDPASPALAVEREALKVVIQRPALVGPAYDAVEPDAYTAVGYARIDTTVAAAGGVHAAGAGGPAWVAALRAAAPDDAGRDLITELAVEPLRAATEPDERYARSVTARLRELAVTRRVVELKSRLQRLNPVEAPDDYNRLFGELVALEQHKRALREQAIGEL